jgi:hypothetical protein
VIVANGDKTLAGLLATNDDQQDDINEKCLVRIRNSDAEQVSIVAIYLGKSTGITSV